MSKKKKIPPKVSRDIALFNMPQISQESTKTSKNFIIEEIEPKVAVKKYRKRSSTATAQESSKSKSYDVLYEKALGGQLDPPKKTTVPVMRAPGFDISKAIMDAAKAGNTTRTESLLQAQDYNNKVSGKYEGEELMDDVKRSMGEMYIPEATTEPIKLNTGGGLDAVASMVSMIPGIGQFAGTALKFVSASNKAADAAQSRLPADQPIKPYGEGMMAKGGVLGAEDNFKYKGPSHEGGGIPVNETGLQTNESSHEVEGEEVTVEMPNGSKYVFSKRTKI